MAYQEISDDVWSKVEPLLVPFRRKKSGGSPPIDFRCLLNGMFYRHYQKPKSTSIFIPFLPKKSVRKAMIAPKIM
jgi:transposase